jgi:hypothetical protein
MNNTTPQLPVELRRQIEKEAIEYTSQFKYGDDYRKAAYEDGATSYAIKRLQDQQEIAELTNWKEEAKAILDPIWDYADTLKVPLGASKTEAVITHVKEAKELLNEVFRKHESGLLPDRFIYEKIKRFLYGE